MSDKVESAAELLKNGQPARVNDLLLSIEENNLLLVTGWSIFLNFSNIDKELCLKELEEIKNMFYNMVASSQSLQEFIAGKSIEYRLYFDDSGKASIAICTEKKGIIKW